MQDAAKNSQVMGIRIESIAVMTATLKQDFGRDWKMEFRKLRIRDLIPASYNPEKNSSREIRNLKNKKQYYGVRIC